jgi:hypothetical protein
VLLDRYMATEKIYDILKTLLSTNLQSVARSLRVGTAQEIGSLFESLQRADANIRSIQQPGKFHRAEQLMLNPERIYRGNHRISTVSRCVAIWQLLNTEAKFGRCGLVKLTQQSLIIMIRYDLPVFPSG